MLTFQYILINGYFYDFSIISNIFQYVHDTNAG